MNEAIEQYLQQIRQVEEALKLTTSAEEIKSLVSLKDDLHELLRLTQEADNLESVKTPPTNTEDDIDDEFKQFMSEIRELDNPKECTKDSSEEDNEENDKAFVEVVGKKCSAPHTHTWGGKSYHNAMICEDNRVDDKTVRVLFTNPTHQEMLPCNFYLSGHCRFDEIKCRFSHGESVPYNELKDYKEPDFTLLHKSNCSVLFRMDDKLWHKGIVSSVDFEKKICKIKLQQKKCETDCDFEFILPIESDDSDNGSTDDSDNSSSDEDGLTDEIVIRNIKLIEQSLLTVPTDRLGQWEEHTRGVGSRLMEKMGYIIGTGLGKNGEGIITPISAQVLPPGRSLDHCMNLREQANGDKNLFSVERKLKRQAEKQKAANEKAYARTKNKTDVFSFINEKIFGCSTITTPSTSAAVHSEPINTNSVSFKNHTTKNLNLANFEISENIRKIEKELQALNQSLQRHKEGSAIYANVRLKIENKNSELARLQASENSIKNEQNVRNNKNKLLIF